MICPLKMMGFMAAPVDQPFTDNATDCEEHKCAWWDYLTASCAIALIAGSLAAIRQKMMDQNGE